jgi:hypothetical protein
MACRDDWNAKNSRDFEETCSIRTAGKLVKAPVMHCYNIHALHMKRPGNDKRKSARDYA